MSPAAKTPGRLVVNTLWIGAVWAVDEEGSWEWSDRSLFPKKVEIGLADQLQRIAIRASIEDGRFTADALRFKRDFPW
jgi:hypothetical protein